jgi:glutaredoxin
MGKIKIYYLEECPYSLMTKESANKLQKQKIYEIELIKVGQNEKHKYKHIQQNHNHYTFPIVLYVSKTSKEYLIGGNSEFQNILKYIDNLTNSNTKMDAKNISNILSNTSSYNKGQKKLFCYLLNNSKICNNEND